MDFDFVQFGYAAHFPAFLIKSLDELWTILLNSTSKYNRYGDYVENGVIADCETYSTTSDRITYGIGIYNFICIIILSMMMKRVSFMKEKFNGRPGLVVPMNMLNSHEYIIEYTLIFLSLSEEIYNFIFGMTEELKEYIPLVKFFVKLLMVIAISIFSYPLFASICGQYLLGYCMIFFSSIAYLCNGVYSTHNEYFCLVGIKMIPLFCAAIIYCSVDLTIVFLFLWKLIKYVKRYRCSLKVSVKSKNPHRDFSFLYVKELLKEKLPFKSIMEDETEESENGVRDFLQHLRCNELRSKIREKVYRQIPGFSLPPRLMIGILVGLYFSYRIFIDNIYDLTPGAWNLIDNLNNKLHATGLNLKISFQMVSGNYSLYDPFKMQNAFKYLTFFYAHLFISCLLVAVFIGFINSVIQSFLLLRNYRLHFQRLTRKGFSSLVHIKDAPEPHGLIIGYVKYSGYQAAYMLWGILITTIFVCALLFFVIGIFLLPLFFLEKSWARKLVVQYGPVLIVSLIFNFLQNLFVKHFFVKENGRLMEVDNRKGFMIYTHCAFFLNAMMGLFNSVKRILIWVFTGVFTFSRIDFSSLPEYLYGFDSGYMCYVGFLYTEQYHFNPIMQCFSNILIDSVDKQEDDEIKMVNKSEMERKRLRYRNLWHLSLTLINNSKLLSERKGFLKGQFNE